MKTGDKFHVEKENYDRLWESFTERLEKGKNVTQAHPASIKDKSSATHSLIQKEGGKKKSGKTNICSCSIQLRGPPPPHKKKSPYTFLAGEDRSELLQIFSQNHVGEGRGIQSSN